MRNLERQIQRHKLVEENQQLSQIKESIDISEFAELEYKEEQFRKETEIIANMEFRVQLMGERPVSVYVGEEESTFNFDKRLTNSHLIEYIKTGVDFTMRRVA